jgi:16S rRNA (cytidine1402-2'-O)-methyltransferase
MPRLVLVPTPIGNLKDITYRAVEVLKNADFIMAEDTRTTGNLLKHYGIENKLMPYHQHNEHKILKSAISRIMNSEVVALVTDAGTPGISDPGFLLARECIRNGIEVECLPGPTSIIPAVVQSGIPCDQFIFLGFLPHKKGRKTRLEEMADISMTMILFESPHRIVKTLKQLASYLGEDRQACVCRELTKIHEENARGTLRSLADFFESKEVKGEIVLVIGGKV